MRLPGKFLYPQAGGKKGRVWCMYTNVYVYNSNNYKCVYIYIHILYIMRMCLGKQQKGFPRLQSP